MRWKKLTLVFDEIASFSFYGPSKFFRFGDFEQFSEKNILVGHIFSLCPINGKRQIFHNFFFKSAFDLDSSPIYGLNVGDI